MGFLLSSALESALGWEAIDDIVFLATAIRIDSRIGYGASLDFPDSFGETYCVSHVLVISSCLHDHPRSFLV